MVSDAQGSGIRLPVVVTGPLAEQADGFRRFLVDSCFVVTRRLRRRPERSHVIDRGRFDLGEPQKTVQRSGLCGV